MLTTNNISNKRLLKTNIIKLNQLLVSNDFVAVCCEGFGNPSQLPQLGNPSQHTATWKSFATTATWKSCATTAIKDENKKIPPTYADGI